MSWTEKVHCTPCRGTTDWVVQNGVWTCFHCGAPMTVAEVSKMHDREKLT